MQFKNDILLNREKRTATIRLYGDIGTDINGHYLAQELAYLDQQVDEIEVRINSDGGDVSHGLSIVSAIDSAQAFVRAYIDGIAASMAAVIALTADEVSMNDYARLMVHDPYYVEDHGKLQKKLSQRARKALENIKQLLRGIMKRRGVDEDKIENYMKEETWFSATDAQTAGFIDAIVQTGKKELAALAPMKLVAKLNKQTKQQPNKEKKMKKVLAKFNLGEDAKEDQVLNAIKEMETGHANQVQKLVDKLVEVGKATGSISEKTENKMRELAGKDLDLFVDLLNVEGVKPSDDGNRISDAIEKLVKAQKTTVKDEPKKAFNEYTYQELKAMKEADNDTFKALYKDYYGEDYKD